MSQAVRNKVYGVIAAGLSIAVVLGFVDEATSNEATSLVNAVLDQVEVIAGLVASILAFVKSLPSRVTVVESKGKHSED
jgi:hypothetical protein